MTAVARIVRLYFRLLGLHLRAMLEYKADFWIMAVATVLMQAVNIVFLSVVFSRVPVLNGWPFWTVVCLFGLIALAEGVGSFFFEGSWRIAEAINLGTLDYLMVRPYPVLLQLTSAEVGINGVTNIITGGLMLILAVAHMGVHWTVARVAWSLLLFLSALAVKLGINIATNCLSFWLDSPSPLFAMAIHQVGELSRFPLVIYPGVLKILIGFVVPFAFVTTFPVGFVTGIGPASWIGMLTPLVALYCLAGALFVFRRGLRRYESAGN